MPDIDYLPIANDPGANVESQADYEIALAPGGSLVNGYVAGTAASNQMNKTWRQSSMIAAAVANVISNALGIDVLDDGDLPTLITNLTDAIETVAASGAWSTGDVKLTMKTAADAGWILCDDGTVGDATSGATHASAANQALFLLLWTNVSNTWAPVVTGRGVSAAADWAAHKRITLTKMLGRALAISGAGAGLDAAALGQNLGANTGALITANLPAHNHGVTDPGHIHAVTDPTHIHGVTDPTHVHQMTDHATLGTPGGSGSLLDYVSGAAKNTAAAATGISVNNASTGVTVNSHATGITTQNTGSGDTFDIMNPTSYLNAMIKL